MASEAILHDVAVQELDITEQCISVRIFVTGKLPFVQEHRCLHSPSSTRLQYPYRFSMSTGMHMLVEFAIVALDLLER